MSALMPEVGHVRVSTPAGEQFDFIPSLGAFNSLGTGAEIISTAADLFDRRPFVSLTAARCVLRACYVGEADAESFGGINALLGFFDGVDADRKPIDVPGLMPASEINAVAQHLVKHGLAGKSQAGGGQGDYSTEFSVAQHVAAAEAHLGLSKEQVLAKTMTELQLLIEAKFPDARPKEYPTRDEYRTQLAAIMARRAAKAAEAAGV